MSPFWFGFAVGATGWALVMAGLVWVVIYPLGSPAVGANAPARSDQDGPREWSCCGYWRDLDDGCGLCGSFHPSDPRSLPR